jgi:hypothetical protein
MPHRRNDDSENPDRRFGDGVVRPLGHAKRSEDLSSAEDRKAKAEAERIIREADDD